MLNPFSQVLYMRELIDRLRFKTFAATYGKASLYSFIIFIVFAAVGERLLENVFQVRLGSLQVFGGLVTLWVAYRFITAGEGSTMLFRMDKDDLAPDISLPYMVGAGTLWVSILAGRTYPIWMSTGLIAGVLAVNLVFVLACFSAFKSARDHRETGFVKYFAILMRVMALFIGAVGVEMIFGGAMELIREE